MGRGRKGRHIASQTLQILPRRGTGVEDQRQLLRLPGQRPQPLAHQGQKLGEGPHVGSGPGIQAVRQGQLRGLIDDEGEAELPEIMTALFVVAALG